MSISGLFVTQKAQAVKIDGEQPSHFHRDSGVSQLSDLSVSIFALHKRYTSRSKLHDTTIADNTIAYLL